MFGKLFKRRSEDISAAELYTKCLKQARLPAFYGPGKVADSYDGRIDLLTLHMTIVMTVGRKHGQEGAMLNQAMYDIMIQDFEIAMRGEGIADTGISRRIKPMVGLFLERTKLYTAALESGEGLQEALGEHLLAGKGDSAFLDNLTAYIAQSHADAHADGIDALKSGHITFAPFTSV